MAVVCLVAGLPSLAVLLARRCGGSGVRAFGSVHGVVAGALLCACVAAAVSGLTVAEARRGPVPGLAAAHGGATVDVRLTGDPRAVLARSGAPGGGSTVVAEAEAVRVDAGGVVTAVRTPVLLSALPGRSAARWLELLPSTRLRVRARLAPPWRPGDREVAVLRVRGAPEVIGRPAAVQRVAGTLRGGLRAVTAGLPADARALLPGLVVGDTSRMTPELREAFEATDLLHLFAVSGSNLTVLLALLIGPPALASRAERRGLAARLGLSLRATALVGGGVTVGFVVLCRPDPSVLRAATCGVITLWAIGTGRRRALLPALAAAVTVLVLNDPWLARSYGFALSVVATAALLTLAPRWSAALVRHGVPERWAEAPAAAAAAQVCCAPLVVVLAAHVSLVAVPCNLLAEAAVAPATVLGFAALTAAPVSMTVARAAAWLAGWPAGWVAWVARKGAALPGAGLDWPGGWTGGGLLALVTLTLVLVAGRLLRNRWWMVAVVVALLVTVVRPAPLGRLASGWPPPGWRLAVCDVGQGDALVLNAGEGAAVVMDTGPEPAPADRCLRALGVRTIPLLILTHFHADHVGGLSGVLAGRRVGEIETTTLDAPAGEAAHVRRLAAAAHVRVVRAAAGEYRRIGTLDWRVLWPPPEPPQRWPSPPGQMVPSSRIAFRSQPVPLSRTASQMASRSRTALRSQTVPSPGTSALPGAAAAPQTSSLRTPVPPQTSSLRTPVPPQTSSPWMAASLQTSSFPTTAVPPRTPPTLLPDGEVPPDGDPRPDGDPLPDGDPNDASVVLLVRAAGLTFLLLGDLEPVAQEELLDRNPWLAGVDVLKVAHHGSAYQDPELLRRLRPRLALISVGAGNTYGHPAPRTVAALRSVGAVVLRTDTDGPIAVTGDGPATLRAVVRGGRGPP
ncbi:ComEC/Rec2 family competence protein [Streptantibioticus silvisoli]